ncbi:MAG: ATP-dependent DNA helicase RecG [Thermovirgaceae bacterium]|nr:ATP-dependent DNA helicase RecG [Thermovirgaceae bacterium]
MTETLTRDSPVRILNGVGTARAARLAKLEVETVEDLLYLFPRRYEDRGNPTRLTALEPGSFSSSIATVVSIERRPTRRRNLSIVTALLSDGAGMAQGIWFNRRGLERVLPPGTKASFYGKIENKGGVIQLTNPEFEIIDDEDDAVTGNPGRIYPIYPGTEGLFQKWLRTLIKGALAVFSAELEDPLPEGLRQKLGLVPLQEALGVMHFPVDRDGWARARKRLAFDEFFLLQTALALRKRTYAAEKGGSPLAWDGPLLGRFKKEIIPFELTGSQQRVLGEITSGSKQEVPMNRLLQGDVGSGKTVVALMFLLAAVDSGFQGAIMAPTEVLAKQHFQRISEWLSGLGVPVHLLSGSLSNSQRVDVLEGISSGEPCIVVGTHALIQKTVRFANLAAVVIDEQHRFGVLQRGTLTEKGNHPHVLVMTATPIPRTLTLSVYGDLAFSTIDELPPGRVPPVTRKIPGADDSRLLSFIGEEIDGGRKTYWVCPVIEESDTLPLMPVVRRHELLSKRFGAERVGILHGQVSADERDRTMDRFSNGEISILVATTVIEVGLDVPGASVMVVEDAHRFGLSQLHQLRGRVGRGSARGYCFLIGKPGTPEGKARIEAMCSTADGFKIAETDLALRGPGELCGIRQHGVTDFRVANLAKDRSLLETARREAFALVNEDPALVRFPELRREVFRKLGLKLKLVETA